jgi:hypothetical protein
MIAFIGGMFTGAVLGIIAVALVSVGRHKEVPNTENSADSDSLNEEKRRRAERKADLDKQFDNLMAYTGKEQKKA